MPTRARCPWRSAVAISRGRSTPPPRRHSTGESSGFWELDANQPGVPAYAIKRLLAMAKRDGVQVEQRDCGGQPRPRVSFSSLVAEAGSASSAPAPAPVPAVAARSGVSAFDDACLPDDAFLSIDVPSGTASHPAAPEAGGAAVPAAPAAPAAGAPVASPPTDATGCGVSAFDDACLPDDAFLSIDLPSGSATAAGDSTAGDSGAGDASCTQASDEAASSSPRYRTRHRRRGRVAVSPDDQD